MLDPLSAYKLTEARRQDIEREVKRSRGPAGWPANQNGPSIGQQVALAVGGLSLLGLLLGVLL